MDVPDEIVQLETQLRIEEEDLKKLEVELAIRKLREECIQERCTSIQTKITYHEDALKELERKKALCKPPPYGTYPPYLHMAAFVHLHRKEILHLMDTHVRRRGKDILPCSYTAKDHCRVDREQARKYNIKGRLYGCKRTSLRPQGFQIQMQGVRLNTTSLGLAYTEADRVTFEDPRDGHEVYDKIYAIYLQKNVVI